MILKRYEQLIARAMLDPAFGSRLMNDPRSAAREAGYPPMFVESLVGIEASSIEEFSRLLHVRIYPAAALTDTAYRPALTYGAPEPAPTTPLPTAYRRHMGRRSRGAARAAWDPRRRA
jgi:hypothetical protein